MDKIAKKPLFFRSAAAWSLIALVVVAAMPLAVSVTNALTHGYWDSYLSVMQQKEKTIYLPNGNRVITLDASWCGTYGVATSLDSARKDTSTTREYYEIKKGSDVTDQDVIDWRKTNCESSLVGNVLETTAKNQKVPEGKVVISTGFMKIASVSSTTLDIYSPALHWDGWRDSDGKAHDAYDVAEKHYIFNRSLNQTKVLDVPAANTKFSDLKAGDSVTALIAVNKDASPYCNSEQSVIGDSPCDLSLFPSTNPGELVAIIRAKPYDSSYTSPVQLGSNVFTVVPCSTSMNGLCASGEMNEKGEYPHPRPLVSWPIWQASLLAGIALLALATLVSRKLSHKK